MNFVYQNSGDEFVSIYERYLYDESHIYNYARKTSEFDFVAKTRNVKLNQQPQSLLKKLFF